MLNRVWLPIPNYNDEIDSLTINTHGINHEKQLYRRLLDTYMIDSPKLVYIANYIAHSRFDKIGIEANVVDNTPVSLIDTDLLYLVHHEYAAQVMLTTVDLILDWNPNAVVIIQGDHGIHSNETHEYMMKMGYTLPQVLEMKHSVISAVRIPPKYGGLGEPVAPLNIPRMLVNRFVGENYEMLP